MLSHDQVHAGYEEEAMTGYPLNMGQQSLSDSSPAYKDGAACAGRASARLLVLVAYRVPPEAYTPTTAVLAESIQAH